MVRDDFISKAESLEPASRTLAESSLHFLLRKNLLSQLENIPVAFLRSYHRAANESDPTIRVAIKFKRFNSTSAQFTGLTLIDESL